MRLRIGNQSAFSASSLLAPFEFALEHGFDAFEFFPDGWSEKDLDASMRARIRRLARERDVRLSVHAGLKATPIDPEGLVLLDRDILLARDLDARVVNIHLDLFRGMEAFVSGVLAVVDTLGSLGIDLAIENTPMTGPDAFNELFDHLGALGLRHRCEVGICVDLGHANICEATRNDYLKFIDALNATVPIVHVHAHENWGDRDSHLTLFTGPSASDPRGVQGWLERLHARGFVGSVILEQWPQPPTLLVDACTKLREMAAEVGDGAEAKRQSTPAEAASLTLEETIARFARADDRRKSWREKLAWVEKLLSESHDGLDILSLVAIYLRFEGTGEVQCEESGGHYRPSHHARHCGSHPRTSRGAADLGQRLHHSTDTTLAAIDQRSVYQGGAVDPHSGYRASKRHLEVPQGRDQAYVTEQAPPQRRAGRLADLGGSARAIRGERR